MGGPLWERSSGKKTGCGIRAPGGEPGQAHEAQSHHRSIGIHSDTFQGNFSSFSSLFQLKNWLWGQKSSQDCMPNRNKERTLPRAFLSGMTRGQEQGETGRALSSSKGSAEGKGAHPQGQHSLFCHELGVFKLESKSRLTEPSNVYIQYLWPPLQMGLWPKKNVLCHKGRSGHARKCEFQHSLVTPNNLGC